MRCRIAVSTPEGWSPPACWGSSPFVTGKSKSKVKGKPKWKVEGDRGCAAASRYQPLKGGWSPPACWGSSPFGTGKSKSKVKGKSKWKVEGDRGCAAAPRYQSLKGGRLQLAGGHHPSSQESHIQMSRESRNGKWKVTGVALPLCGINP